MDGNLKQEKIFAIHWISFKFREKFCRSCSVCNESAEESHCLKDSSGKLLRFVENLSFLLFDYCHFQYIATVYT